jgi:acyl-[acyl-carrier-protein]-phospholipid O-acyltransferase/long-chain-fatty-acid--[acyl-carrier-protein] ligase
MDLAASPAGWRVAADLFVLAAAGGVFSVPLYTVLQTAGEPQNRARAIAANNIVNSVFQVTAVLGVGAAVGAGMGAVFALMLSGLTVLLLLPALARPD